MPGLTTWANGAHAVVVAGNRVGLLGGYGDGVQDLLTIGVLDGDHPQVVGERRLTLPDGGPLPGA